MTTSVPSPSIPVINTATVTTTVTAPATTASTPTGSTATTTTSTPPSTSSVSSTLSPSASSQTLSFDVKNLSKEEIENLFENNIISSTNLKTEKQRNEMRELSTDKKRLLLKSFFENNADIGQIHACIQKLNALKKQASASSRSSTELLLKHLNDLHVNMRTKTTHWLTVFDKNNGLTLVADIIMEFNASTTAYNTSDGPPPSSSRLAGIILPLHRTPREDKEAALALLHKEIVLKCLEIFKAFVYTDYGVDACTEYHVEAIASALYCDHDTCAMNVTCQILVVLAVLDFNKVLLAVNKVAKLMANRRDTPLWPLVNGLKMNALECKTSIMMLINALLVGMAAQGGGPLVKWHVLNELGQLGLRQILSNLKEADSTGIIDDTRLLVQISQFETQEKAVVDEILAACQLDDWSDARVLLDQLLPRLDKVSRAHVTSILQHLTLLQSSVPSGGGLYSESTRNAYLSLAEECVSRIVLQREQLAPDYDECAGKFRALVDTLSAESTSVDGAAFMIQHRILAHIKRLEDELRRQRQAQQSLSRKQAEEYERRIRELEEKLKQQLQPGADGDAKVATPLPDPPLPTCAKPDKALVAVPWSSIQAKDYDKSFWQQIDTDDFASDESIFTRVKDLFEQHPTVVAATAQEKKTSSSVVLRRSSASSTPQEPPQFDVKLVQSFNIFLKAERLTPGDVVLWLEACDTDKLTREFVARLRKFVPHEHHYASKQTTVTFDADPNYQKFLLSIAKVRRFNEKLASIALMHDFRQLSEALLDEMRVASQACHGVRTSDKLHKVLELVLLVGNYMNSSSSGSKFSAAAAANGFSLKILPRLAKIRSTTEKHKSLLHVLVEILAEKNEALLDFPKDLPPLDAVADLNETHHKIEELKAKLAQVKSNLRLVDENPESSEKAFVDTMTAFLNENTLATVEQRYAELTSAFADLARFYAFDSHVYTLQQCMRDMAAFVADFSKCCRESTASTAALPEISTSPKRISSPPPPSRRRIVENMVKAGQTSTNTTSTTDSNRKSTTAQCIYQALESGKW